MSQINLLSNDIIYDANQVKQYFNYQVLDIKYSEENYIIQNSWKIVNMNKFSKSTFDGILLDFLIKNRIIESYNDFEYFSNHYPNITNFNSLIKFDLLDFRIKLLHNNSDSPFIPISILDWIIENNNYHYYYQLKINGVVLNFNVWWYDKLTEQDQKLLIYRTSLIVFILLFLYNVYHISYKKEINLNYFATPFKKETVNECNPKLDYYLKIAVKYYQNLGFKYNLEKISNTISTVNVNGGMTNHVNNTIVIWRCEEFYKVLTHELIHYFELEKIKLPNLVKYFNINISNTYPIYPNETITELQTFYLFYVYLTITNNLNTVKLRNMIRYEQKYQLSKIRQLLNHNKIRSLNMIWNNSDPKNTINLNCSFVYYYLFKALVLSDINMVVYRLIKPSLKCSKFYINELVSHIYTCYNQLNLDTNRIEDNSLKMSIFG